MNARRITAPDHSSNAADIAVVDGLLVQRGVHGRPRVDWDDALATVRREAWRLPVLREGRPSPRLPQTWEGVALRLQAALWEVAARSDIPVTPGTSIGHLARLLVGYGAIIPPAGDAIRTFARMVEEGCRGGEPRAATTVAEAARLADRLAGYLALRAHFG